MSLATTADHAGPTLRRRLIELVPGIALLLAIGYGGKLIEQTIAAYGKANHLALPNFEYVLWAIVIGLIVANTVGVPRIFRAGVATYEFWLKLGIVLLGVRFLLGAVGLFVFPVVGHLLGMSDHAYGLWAGLGIDNTAEATAAGNLWSEQAGKIAVLAKTTRNATIGFVVLGYAIYWATRGEAQTIENKAAFLWNKFPKFVLGFIVVSLAATLGVFSKEQAADIANLSRWAFLLTFAGVGLSTDFREMRKQGFYPFVVGAVGEIGIAILTLGIVIAVQPWLPA